MMIATEADLLQLSPPSSLGGGVCGIMGNVNNNYNTSIGNSSTSVLIGSGITSGGSTNYRAKPGHCNGTVNSTINNNASSSEMNFTNIPTSFMHLPVSTASLISTLHNTTPAQVSAAAINNVLSDGNESDQTPSMLFPASSPKIRKSFGSRITGQMGRGSPPTKTVSGVPDGRGVETEHHTYFPGDTVDGIPTLSPPPYKSSSTTGSNSSVTGNDPGENERGKLTSYSVVKRGASGYEPVYLQRVHQNEKQMMSPSDTLNSLPKSGGSNVAKQSSSVTNRSNSSTSMGSIGGGIRAGGITTQRNVGRENNMLAQHREIVGPIGGGKVGFGESSAAPTTSVNNTNNKTSSSTTTSMPITTTGTSQHRGVGSTSAVTNSKAVNGILRKGSVPGNEIVKPSAATGESTERKHGGDKDRESISKRARKGKDGVTGERSSHKSKSGKGKDNSSKLGLLNDSNGRGNSHENDGDKSKSGGGPRSRSNSTKSSSNKDKQQEKIQKDLALTRDLPWCGCWGNGCL